MASASRSSSWTSYWEQEATALAKCVDVLRSGGFPVVWRFDRLGRSMRHLISLVEDLLTHHCEIFPMNGESRRFRESMTKKSGHKAK